MRRLNNAALAALALVLSAAPAAPQSGGVAPANRVYASPPSGGAGKPSFRDLVGADLPLPFKSGTRSGNTSKFVTTTGTLTSSNCVRIDADGNFVDAGAGCGGGDGSWGNARVAITSAYTAGSGDCGSTIALGGGAFYALTVSAASGYESTCVMVVANEDAARGKKISVNGHGDFILWPKQTLTIFASNNAWLVTPPQRWKLPANTTIYFDKTNGADTNDCLAAGAGNACETPQRAWDIASNEIDLNGRSILLQSASGQTYTTTGYYLVQLSSVVGTGPTISGGGGGAAEMIVFDGAGSTFKGSTGGDAFVSLTGVLNVPVKLQNMTISQGPSSALGGCVGANVPGYIQIGTGVIFHDCVISIFAATGGIVQILGDFTNLAGTTVSQQMLFDQQIGGNIQAAGYPITVTLTGSPNWSIASTVSSNFGLIWLQNVTFSGASTGTRYLATDFGVIITGGACASLPGNAPGSAPSPGYCN
ncbi:hypothetical protein RA307_23685 [Xanthobacteraceae bacterium Astr-EGSB]|uniref:hypothetical protein n=1 Tax=Astrobacterium formosum TaxID=3069710 RepID=UPI0027AF5AED|nr:hypothetical protein [Xanthobacteraceae bacterium Astr-EGSB]